MLLDNTHVMGAGFPNAALRRAGLMGVGQSIGIDTTAAGDTSTPSTFQDVLTGLNAEALYLTNIVRAQKGQAPLSASDYSPQVNVGVSQSTRNTALIVVAALLGGAWLFSRKR